MTIPNLTKCDSILDRHESRLGKDDGSFDDRANSTKVGQILQSLRDALQLDF